jgi:hypothetical protein
MKMLHGKCGMALAALATLASLSWADGRVPYSGVGLQALMQQWIVRDGAATVEVGHQLSLCFVSTPREFLLAMSKEPETWRTWLDELPVHTCTVYREGARSEVEQLRSRMLSRVKRYAADREVGLLARELRTKLEVTAIREID